MMIDHNIKNSLNTASEHGEHERVLSISDQSSSDPRHRVAGYHAIRKPSCNAYNSHAKRAEASRQTNACRPFSLALVSAVHSVSAFISILRCSVRARHVREWGRATLCFDRAVVATR